LFQWYVATESRQYEVPPVENVVGFAPFRTVRPFQLLKSSIWAPVHV